MNLLEQFARHIEFCGLGVFADAEKDGNIFWGIMPDTPDTAVCVFSHDSGIAGSDMGARIQVVTRAKTAKEAYELSQAVANTLDGFDGFLIGDGARASIEALNTSAGLGADTKKRENYSSNFLVRYCDF